VEVRHRKLDRARPLHLLAADPESLLHHPQAERQVGVEAAAQLAHEPGADEQPCEAISASAGLSLSVGIK
jgi:hypothetical protein